MKTKTILLVLTPLLLVLSACYSLAEDITPPPGYEFEPPPQPTEDVMYYPLVPPDPVAGAAIFEESCAPCHGPQGLGNGPQAAQLPNPVAAIGTPELSRQSLPGEWYKTVTEGRIDRYMPPFISLTERQRWDVIAYVYGLSTDAETVGLGQELYQEICAACHGDEGRGDGAEAVNLSVPAADFTDQLMMSELSANDLFEGIGHPSLSAPPEFGAQFSDSERWALADYLRSLSFAPSEVEVAAGPAGSATAGEPTPEVGSEIPAGEVAAAPEAAADTGLGVVNGQVVNISSGELPPGLQIVLHGFDQFQEVVSITTTVQTEGNFSFDAIEMPAGRAFIVTTEYQNSTYTSDVAVVQEESQELTLPITVYDSTTDTSALSIERLHVLFEFVSPDTLRVAELVIISNLSDKIVIAPEEGQPVLNFSLPEEVTNLQFQDGQVGQEFVLTPDGFGDIRGITPGQGQHQILYSYDLPYEKEADLSQPVSLPVNAIVVLVPDLGVKINSDILVDEGTRDIQGITYQMYTGGDLPAGSQLPLSISGRPKLEGAGILTEGSSSNLAVGLAALGVTVLGAGVWIYRRSSTADEIEELEDQIEEQALFDLPPTEMDAEELMDAIIALDDRVQAGDLPEEAYQKRRRLFKEQLRKLLETDAKGE